MSRIEQQIDLLRRNWVQPRQAIHRGQRCPFLLACSFDPLPAASSDIEDTPVVRENDLREFWNVSRKATLFKDQEYGQWGVEIMCPRDAVAATQWQRQMRPVDFMATDFVFGRFFGDSDLLMMRTDETASDFGAIMVVLPMDPRSDWPRVATLFGDFLERLAVAQGDKYWEVS